MNNRTPDLLNELQGYVELGMEKESLGLARKLLKQRNISPPVFIDVLKAVLIHADRLRRWKPLIESVHSKFSIKQKRLVQNVMFHFYVALGDFAVAVLYIPRNPREADDLLFCMWTLLNTRDLSACHDIAERFKKIAKNPQSEFEISCLSEAIGCYGAQNGWFEVAENMWQQGTHYEWFDVNAWEGLINVQLAKAHGFADDARQNILMRKPDYNPTLPRNEEMMKKSSLKEFERIKQVLNRALPEEELWRFGRL